MRRCVVILVCVLLSISLIGCGGGGAAASSNSSGSPSGPPPLPTVTLTVDNNTITGDEQTVHLSWTSTNATAVTLNNGLGQQPANGAVDVSPTSTTTYTATATGAGGTSSPASVTITVQKDLSVLLQASLSNITQGQSVTLTWQSSGASSLSIDNGIGSVTPVSSGSTTMSPTTTTTYTATAANNSGNSVTSSVTVNVSTTTVTLSVDKSCVAAGGVANLSWSAMNASTVTINPGAIAATPASGGSVAVTPATTTTYTATAQDANGTSFTSAPVQVQVGGCTVGVNNLKHIVVFVQENRSFDHYFGMLDAYRQSQGLPAGEVDGFDPNVLLPNYSGTSNVHPFHQRTACVDMTTPGWNESHYDAHYDPATNTYQPSTWTMKGFMKTTHSVTYGTDVEGQRVMGYYDWTDLPYYYELATQYATSDRWFSSLMGPTEPNRKYIFTGTSFGWIRSAPPTHAPYTQETIFKALTDAGVSWRYYYQVNAQNNSAVYLSEWAEWSELQGHVYNIANWYSVLSDPRADQLLPEVIFIERSSGDLDEHPHSPLGVQAGAKNTKKIIDALMQSSAWPNSAFILTYDEGGGFYDHVPPISVPLPDAIAPMYQTSDRQATFDQSGFRVPLVVVSPWVKKNFVSHTPREHTSILKLIETRFGLPPLTARDAAADDMQEFFDFNSPPRTALPVLPAQPAGSDPGADVCDRTLENDPTQP